MRRKLPTGIQTFREIREGNYYYVDKTAHIERLIENSKHYFLSRPRRFGKSLLVDTIKELFEGNETLFRGLRIHDKWDWARRHPVVRLDFSGSGFRTSSDLNIHLGEQLSDLEAEKRVVPRHSSIPGRFRNLIQTLHEQTGERVVVLVDEYDKPVLDPLTAGDRERARAHRDTLRGLYGNIKACDADIRFSFLTGVSKFTRVSLFSELNNLRDITLVPDFATICGYTEGDLDTVFAPELEDLDRDAIRDWYNGYNWLGEEKAYNPFGILLLFQDRQFRAHWFETGSPAFLLQTMRERGVFTLDLEGMITADDLLSSFDVDDMATEALLFQTGYLTIADELDMGGEPVYRLTWPNREVRQGLNRHLLRAVAWNAAHSAVGANQLYTRLAAADLPGLEAHFKSLFAAIPYNWHVNNDMARHEGYYASVMYAHLAALGAPVAVEDASTAGRLDMSVRLGGQVYLFEFKVAERAGEGTALAQLVERGYAEKYRAHGQPVHLIGIEFSANQRCLDRFDAVTLD